jgi:predicted phosphodiesterase
MGNKITTNIILALSLCTCFSACNKVDVGGMFVSTESANQRYEQSAEWNNVHPFNEIVVPADDYVIFSMSDSHVGGTANLDTFLARAASANAQAVVMVGDLTTGHKEDYDVFQQHLSNPDSLALFPIAGNHDLYFDGWEQYYARFGTSTYYFSVITPTAKDLYICLESGSGTLGSEQMEWLENVLENERADYRRCIVFTHDNFFRYRHTASTSPVVEELQTLMDLFTKYQVDMLVAGHDHEKSEEVFGNTTYLVMDALLDGYDQAGYLQLSIKSGSIEYDFINL